jgi:hypothetical protein
VTAHSTEARQVGLIRLHNYKILRAKPYHQSSHFIADERTLIGKNRKRTLLHTHLCPCRSGWIMASCCLDKSDGKLRKRVKSLQPPSPVTNFAHPKCYLRSTHDCSEDISREHYISANILEQLGSSISVIGFPFLAPNETKSFAIDNLTSKILCRRHNEALSPLDQEAGIFFRELSLSLSDLEKAPSRTHNIHLASGSALELWMLKTACGMYFSRIAAKDNVRLAGTHTVDEAKITAAFFENKWDDRAGLYFNGHYGSAMTTMAGIVVRTLSEDIGSFQEYVLRCWASSLTCCSTQPAQTLDRGPALSGDQANSSLKKTSASTL